MSEPLDGDMHTAFLGDILAELRLIREAIERLEDREQKAKVEQRKVQR